MPTSSKRILAYDRARALAVIGMVFVNTANMMHLCTIDPWWMDAVVDFICGRAAVLFVMLAFSMGYILAGLIFATVWGRRFKRGPLEHVMDFLTRLSLKPHRKPLPV